MRLILILSLLLTACNSQNSHRPSFVISQSHEAATERSITPEEESMETPSD